MTSSHKPAVYASPLRSLIFFVQVFVFTSYGRHVVKLFNNGLHYYPSTKSKRLCNGSSFCLVLDHCQLLYISSHITLICTYGIEVSNKLLANHMTNKMTFQVTINRDDL